MQDPIITPNPGFLSRLPKPSLRQRRLIAMTSAAAIVVVGLGAFALLPPVEKIQTAAPVMVAQNDSPRATPRMLESTPFSFADLVERVSPAVVSIKSETTNNETSADENIPQQFRDLFQQFGQRPQQPQPQPRRPHPAPGRAPATAAKCWTAAAASSE